MYLVIRTWANAGALADAMQQRPQEVTALLREVPGFVAYYATRAGDTVTSVTVCDSHAGTQESTRRAGEWVKTNVTGAAIGAPQIAETGRIGVEQEASPITPGRGFYSGVFTLSLRRGSHYGGAT